MTSTAPQIPNLDYTFDLDENDSPWLSFLRRHGYVVLRNVLSGDEVNEARNLVWRDICGAHGISRHDPSRWKKKWHLPHHGIDASLAQTAGPWFVRGNANVRTAFSEIWDTSDLITSMDAVILWRSDEVHGTEGLHLDQNPFTKPQLDCIQGMVPLLPVTRDVGGLQVVPFSHTPEAKKAFCEEHPEMSHSGDFVLVHSIDDQSAVLLECEAGDLVLWDSRTIHGGVVGPKACNQEEVEPHLTRMSVTVAMTPRAWASLKVQEARCKGFERGISFNHCPHEAGTSTGTFHAKRKRGYCKFELTESQRKVL